MSVMSEINVKLLEKLFERKPEYNTMSFEDMVRVSAELSEKTRDCVNRAIGLSEDACKNSEFNYDYEKYAQAYDMLLKGSNYGYEASLLMYLVNSCQTYKNEQERRKAAKVEKEN